MKSVEEEPPTMEEDSNDQIPRSTQQMDGFLTTQKACYELKIGMKANSDEEAYDMYNGYAFNKGFSIRRDDKTFKRGTKEVIRSSFVCSREGFRQFSDPSEEKKCNRLDSRCGCGARVIFKVENGVYEISQLVAEHNHPLVESDQRHLIRSARKIPDTSKGVIKSMADSGIRVSRTYAYMLNESGGYKSVGYTETDCHNFIQVERSKRIAAGDGQNVVNHFKHNQLENPMFFYTVQVDDENRMSNFFWRDGISKLDYECFGDVVVFDTTYRTNKYNMICAPFVGVNHHWKNVLFGCAFLSNETTASFVWLFNAFLESMDYKAPKTIFTDQDHAIGNAVAQVFPNTQHRLCGWHISKNAAVNIASLYQKEGFRAAFNFLLYHCDNEKYFEEKWKEMIVKWECANNSWLLKLYTLRQKWAPAFSRDVFSCDISSSQRSESTNNVFQHMASKTLALTEFVDHYGKNAEKMREVEVINDFKCASGNPCITSHDCAILKHACKVYTHKIFDKFQDEFNQTTSISVLRCVPNGTFQTYTMKRQGGTREYIVEFNPSDRSISCCCKRFESLGLLCRHALRVLNLNDVNEIPEQYILKRWTKDAKQGLGMMERHANLAQDKCGSSAKTLRLNRLMRKAFALMNLCANLEATTDIAERNMDRTFEEVRIYNASLCGGDGSDAGDTSIPVLDVPMMNPPRRRKKGVTNGRLKGALERRRKRKTSRNVTNTNPTPDFLMQSTVMQPPGSSTSTPNDLLSEYPPGYFTSMIQSCL